MQAGAHCQLEAFKGSLSRGSWPQLIALPRSHTQRKRRRRKIASIGALAPSARRPCARLEQDLDEWAPLSLDLLTGGSALQPRSGQPGSPSLRPPTLECVGS